jgi:hypothetical protein
MPRPWPSGMGEHGRRSLEDDGGLAVMRQADAGDGPVVGSEGGDEQLVSALKGPNKTARGRANEVSAAQGHRHHNRSKPCKGGTS